LFITGLGDPLRTDLSLQQPEMLDDTIIFARAYEQRNSSCDEPTPQQNRFTGPFSAKLATTTVSTPVVSASRIIGIGQRQADAGAQHHPAIPDRNCSTPEGLQVLPL
jgi:hypothetical protein